MPQSDRPQNSTLPVLILTLLILGSVISWFYFSGNSQMRKSHPPQPSIVSRAEWEAHPLNLKAPEEFGVFDPQTNPAGVLTYSGDLRAVLNTIVVHHSAYYSNDPKEIQELHMDKRGFADIAYHFLISADGTIYEGREIKIRGAHVQGYNTGSVGVVLFGNFNEAEPSKAQLASLRALVDYLRHTYEIGYLAGHRDYPNQSPDGTECPGETLYPLLPAMAREMGMRFGIDGYLTPAWMK